MDGVCVWHALMRLCMFVCARTRLCIRGCGRLRRSVCGNVYVCKYAHMSQRVRVCVLCMCLCMYVFAWARVCTLPHLDVSVEEYLCV